MNYQTIKVRLEGNICYLQLYRPTANNTINGRMIDECNDVLMRCESEASVVVLEGLPEVFCYGADFQGMYDDVVNGNITESSAEKLYTLWNRLANGPYVSICHARGKTNAGGMGFVAACDIVLADDTATFGLSELLFGIYPACVLPFMIRKTGFQKAHYLTLMTRPIPVEEAHKYNLVDAYDAHSETLVRKHLLRLRNLSKTSVAKYKQYINQLNGLITTSKVLAVENNQEMHQLPGVGEGIFRFVESGKLPWEN